MNIRNDRHIRLWPILLATLFLVAMLPAQTPATLLSAPPGPTNQLLLNCPPTITGNTTTIQALLYVNGNPSCVQAVSLNAMLGDSSAGSYNLSTCTSAPNIFDFAVNTQQNGTYTFTATTAGASAVSCTAIRLPSRPPIRVPDLPPALALLAGLFIAFFILRKTQN